MSSKQIRERAELSVSRHLGGEAILGFELRVSLLLYLLSHYASTFFHRIFSR
jgi:hypothetical protein